MIVNINLITRMSFHCNAPRCIDAMIFYCRHWLTWYISLYIAVLNTIYKKCVQKDYYLCEYRNGTWRVIIPPALTKLKGGILVSPCPSVRPSVRLWTEPCPLCIFNNTGLVHFLFAHLIKQLHKVCRVLSLFRNSKLWNFCKFFKFVTFTLSSFDLGSNMTQ